MIQNLTYDTPPAYISFSPETEKTTTAKHLRLSEPIIVRLDANNIVTVNNVNSHVFNSVNLMIVDVDLGPDRTSSITTTLVSAVEAIAKVSAASGFSFRLYETRGGLRYLCGSKAARLNLTVLDLMKQLKADPRYISLCEATATYRARLTPKPFGIHPPLHSAVCRYIETVGSDHIQPSLHPIIDYHDVATKALSGLRQLV